jgi:hypothetical protein
MKTKGKINTKQKNKTLKTKIKSCNDFCKNVYVNQINKDNKEFAKTFYKPTNKDNRLRMSNCKNNFCNMNCKKNYKYTDTTSEKRFKQNMKNNFITNMRPSLIKTMKTKGAISYCDGFIYNPFNKNKNKI